MRLLRIFGRILSIAVQRKLAHRANLVFEGILTTLSVAAGIAAVAIVFTHTHSLAGWSMPEILVLLGMFQVVSGLLATFVQPNLSWFAEKVTGGQLDAILLQPVPSLFSASLGTCEPWSLYQVGLGLAVIGMGAAPLRNDLTFGDASVALVLLAAGTIIAWASRVLLACLAFWAPGVEPTVFYGALWELGRYPINIYHPLVRRLLTYVVPVAFISTIPAQALTRGVSPALLVGGVVAAAAATWLAVSAWNAGLRRYTSATS